MLVLDIRFMIHTPYVINNLCIKNNQIYLVDLGLYKKRNSEYIDLTFNRLINKIYVFNKWKNYPIILFFFAIGELRTIFCVFGISVDNNLIFLIFVKVLPKLYLNVLLFGNPSITSTI